MNIHSIYVCILNVKKKIYIKSFLEMGKSFLKNFPSDKYNNIAFKDVF